MKAFKAQNINYSKKANKTQSIQVLEGLSEFRFPGYIIKQSAITPKPQQQKVSKESVLLSLGQQNTV